MNDPDWSLYRTFLAVCRTGSLSGAARDLGLTQPTAGRHVDELERLLRRTLFTRSPQGLMPTDAALEIRPYAESLATTAAALLRQVSGATERVEGVVRITASDVIGVEVLPPILARLQAAHPGLVVELSLSDQVEDLLHREADVAVRMTRPVQDALVVRSIGEIELGLYAHPDYLTQAGTPETFADLSLHRMIGFDRQTAFVRMAAAEMRRLNPGFSTVEEIGWHYRTDNNLAQLAAIRAGAGIGFCQTRLAEREPRLQRVLPEVRYPLPSWVAMHEDLKTSPRCRATFDALVEGLQDYVSAPSSR
ncbi:LysR family transcriptional regulator [Rhizobium straminoryzae]|uniref:LysR family transcriptional regulator n=1 Tax=Rhizobium straminoryzae TaxID=1387186 RepID=A0A549T878_9HYPH|nr:LysR family transcriptional regulator [Rhizobium straminoryzae]TRL38073.1 LysR family transcriptional regulator [Rhizobium straminoryzae]